MPARPPRYDFRAIEEKWRARWEAEGIYRVDLRDAPRPYYNLMMFPYPSAEGLHVGNVYAFVGSDIHGRFRAAQGYDVFEPMGFDAFGIHSENFAIKRGIHPRILTARNVARFREEQLKRIGNRFDWSHEVNTTDPRYYRWTQWIFAQLFKAGLAERKKAAVNWCPKDKTVLADEQVINGRCERCDSIVERRELEQWFLKITAYADRLLEHLDWLDWSERVKAAQRNWIGRSEGLEFAFRVRTPEINHRGRRGHRGGEKREQTERTTAAKVEGAVNVAADTREISSPPASVSSASSVVQSESGPAEIRVYTTRPDTIYGATFVVLSPEHPLVDAITVAGRRAAVARYRAEAISRRTAPEEAETRPITGVFTGAHAVHPLTGADVPIWVADYVLAGYGTGAIMAVPAHDERDFAFARAMGLPVREVVVAPGGSGTVAPADAHRGTEVPADDAGGQRGTEVPADDAEGSEDPIAAAGGAGDFSPRHRSPAFQSRDGGASPASPRGGGTEGGVSPYTGQGILVDSGPYTGMPSAEASAAIIARFAAEGAGTRAVHYQLRDWLISRQRYWGPPIPIVHCPEHGAVAVPDDQLPVVLPDLEDYQPTGTGDSPLAKIPSFVRTTCPVCGGPARRETDVMDNFLDSAWYYLRYPSSDDDTRPWDPALTRKWLPVAMYIGGAEHSVLHLLYARFIAMALHDLGHLPFDEPFTTFRAHGMIIKDGAKISKSRGNVINPDEYLATYGADVLRCYLMFMGPYEQGGDFSDRGIGGVVRFLDRVWRLMEERTFTAEDAEIAKAGGGEEEDEPRRTQRPGGGNNSGSARRAPGIPPISISPPSSAASAISAVKSPSPAMHEAIKRVTEDIPALKYNTAIAALMEYANALTDKRVVSREEVRALLVLLAPFAPYVAEELWERLGEPYSVHRQPWPAYDPAALRRETITLVVQVDGRVRDRVELPADATAEEARAAALASEKARRAVGERTVRDVVYVPGRLANVVTAG